VRERSPRGLHRQGGSLKLLGIGVVRLARAAKNLSRAKVAMARLTNLILMCGFLGAIGSELWNEALFSMGLGYNQSPIPGCLYANTAPSGAPRLMMALSLIGVISKSLRTTVYLSYKNSGSPQCRNVMGDRAFVVLTWPCYLNSTIMLLFALFAKAKKRAPKKPRKPMFSGYLPEN